MSSHSNLPSLNADPQQIAPQRVELPSGRPVDYYGEAGQRVDLGTLGRWHPLYTAIANLDNGMALLSNGRYTLLVPPANGRGNFAKPRDSQTGQEGRAWYRRTRRPEGDLRLVVGEPFEPDSATVTGVLVDEGDAFPMRPGNGGRNLDNRADNMVDSAQRLLHELDVDMGTR